MRRRRRRRQRLQGSVELNLAAMLDMAFQLLAFFILTFKPAPLEGHIALRMPGPQPVTKVAQGEIVGSDVKNENPLAGLETLVVTALSNRQGDFAALRIGEGEPTGSLRVFEDRLSAIFADPDSPFRQAILQMGSNLKYEHVMQLLDVCTRIKLPSGEPLSQLSFVELPESQGGGQIDGSP